MTTSGSEHGAPRARWETVDLDDETVEKLRRLLFPTLDEIRERPKHFTAERTSPRDRRAE